MMLILLFIVGRGDLLALNIAKISLRVRLATKAVQALWLAGI